VTNVTTGQSNTATLITLDSNSVTAGTQLHQAAQDCSDLNEDAHTDWYLPSQNELNVLYTNRAAIGNFNLGGWYYWTSVESANTPAWRQRFSDGQ